MIYKLLPRAKNVESDSVGAGAGMCDSVLPKERPNKSRCYWTASQIVGRNSMWGPDNFGKSEWRILSM